MPEFLYDEGQRVYIAMYNVSGTIISRRHPLYLADSNTYKVALDERRANAAEIFVTEENLAPEEG